MSGVTVIDKKCRKCGQVKLAADFVRNVNRKDGLHSYCKVCHGVRNADSLRGLVYRAPGVESKKCGNCASVKPADDFSRRKGRDGLHSYCHACVAARSAVWFARQDVRVKEKLRLRSLRAYHKNPGLAKEWKAKNRELCRAYTRAYFRKNPDKARAWCGERRAKLIKATPVWADRAALLMWYSMAERVSACLGIPHHVDHVFPLKGRTVSGLHHELNLQVLPAALNHRKSNSVRP